MCWFSCRSAPLPGSSRLASSVATSPRSVVGGGWFRTPVASLVDALFTLGLGVAGWWFLAFLLNTLAPSFGARQDKASAYKVAAWTATPLWLAGGLAILGSVPYLDWLAIVGLLGALVYSAMLGMWSLSLLMGTPESKAPGHILAAMAIAFVAIVAVATAVQPGGRIDLHWLRQQRGAVPLRSATHG